MGVKSETKYKIRIGPRIRLNIRYFFIAQLVKIRIRPRIRLNVRYSFIAQLVKKSTSNAGDPQFDSWVGKIRWRRDRLPTRVGTTWTILGFLLCLSW